ncbi:unnamed protein product [Trichogramma brassicae]|uniref:Uncharacterized protein n=1 Tax=Trichogramma brassicae TaxID=86971 RepID=A0A6H5IKI3_9HYME|nr:unnamed protein product [Trichogramma brassicae]
MPSESIGLRDRSRGPIIPESQGEDEEGGGGGSRGETKGGKKPGPGNACGCMRDSNMKSSITPEINILEEALHQS